MTNFVRVWVLFSALLAAAGWILSGVHQLNGWGYEVFFALVVGGWLIFGRGCETKSSARKEKRGLILHKLWRRYQKPLPAFFLILALMSLVGGFLYVSMDGDGLAYRTPRVLHWLGDGHWYWIRSVDERLNIAGCNFEWLTAPLVLLTRTDRFFFLINICSYLMLPGLIFSVFIRLGVRRRVALWWMWILASGWCFILQAGSTHNDSYAAVYALAAVDLALRAREKKSPVDLWLSLLAVAYLSGIKQTNVPLALLWLIAAWPARQLFFSRPGISLAVGGMALVASFLPMAVFNYHYTGSWTGITLNSHVQLTSPFWGIVGNIFCILWENLMPPFIPCADHWNTSVAHFLTTPLGSHFTSFERFANLRHSVDTETAGIGLPICLLILLSLALAGKKWPAFAGGRTVSSPPLYIQALRWAPWPLLLLFMAKVGVFAVARILSPYYVFFFPSLLILPVHAGLVHQRWWWRLGILVMLMAVGMLVISRERPLFPVQTITTELETRYPDSKVLTKIANAYSFRSSFEHLRNLFLKTLPPDPALVVGYFTIIDKAEAGLWLPWRRLKVERFLPDDTLDQLQQAGIHYVILDDAVLNSKNETIKQWADSYGGQLIDQVTYQNAPSLTLLHVYLVRLGPAGLP